MKFTVYSFDFAKTPNNKAVLTSQSPRLIPTLISLLVSILLPSLNRAKELAKRASCLAQQRSIALAQSIYAGENAGRIVIGYSGTPRRNYWIKQGGKFYLHGMLYDLKYLSDPKSLYCPAVKPGCFAFDWYSSTSSDNTWADNAVRASLVPRPEVNWDWTQDPPTVAAGETWPSLLKFGNKAICSDACGYWDYLLHMHVDGVNVAYGDGSAQWVSEDLFLDDLKAIPDDDEYTCYDTWPDIFDELR